MRCKAQSAAIPGGIASICNAAARPYRLDSTDPISVFQWTSIAKIWQIHQTAAMTTMNISLPDPLKEFVDEEVREGGFASTSDYMRDLVRQRQRAKSAEFLRPLIAEGIASGPATPQEPDFFDKMRERARARAGGE